MAKNAISNHRVQQLIANNHKQSYDLQTRINWLVCFNKSYEFNKIILTKEW